MNKIIKALCAASIAGLPFIGLADNFNYANPMACKMALNGQQDSSYMMQAQKLAFEQKPFSEEWKHFMNEAQFFNQFSLANSISTSCDDNTCTATAALGCSFAFDTSKAPWTTVVKSLLEKEVSYLKQGKYDPSLNSDGRFNLVCTYKKGAQNDWKNCHVQQFG